MMLDGTTLRYREVVRKLRDLCLIQKTHITAAVDGGHGHKSNDSLHTSNGSGNVGCVEFGEGSFNQAENKSNQQISEGSSISAAVNEALFTVLCSCC